MKILQVNCVYKTGSTGKIVYDIHSSLIEQNIESIVCYGRGKKLRERGVYKTCGELYAKFNNLISRITGLMYGGCEISTRRLMKIIMFENPDIVHLHCINGYFVNIYKIITWLNNNNIKTVLTLHSEFMYTANCGYALECNKWLIGCGGCQRLYQETKSLIIDNTAKSWKKMKEAFEYFNDNLSVVSVSPWLMERAKNSPILKDKAHLCVFNGLNTDVFKFSSSDDIIKKYAPNGEKIVFHATAWFSDNKDDLKGGYWVLELAKRMKDVCFIVAGDIRTNGAIPKNVNLLGKVYDQKYLAKLYSSADVTLLTSKKETFSMVVAESLCCGTPVVGFKAGAPEQITIKEYSEFVEQGDILALQCSVLNMLQKNYNKVDIMNVSHNKYSNNVMCSKYKELYLRMIK